MQATNMQPSRMGTSNVQAAGPNPATMLLAASSDTPWRVTVLNIGSVSIFIAYDGQALQESQGTANSFELPANVGPVTFLLRPEERLYASSQGDGGKITWAASAINVADWTAR